MAGFIGLSIDRDDYEGDFVQDLFWLTFYQQHLGEEYSGLSSYSPEEGITIKTHRGLFRTRFSNDLDRLAGTEGIGYCGPTREPYLTNSKWGTYSACFSGSIMNLGELMDRFKNFGHIFERQDDIELIAKLMAQKDGVIEGISHMDKEVKGAYSLLVLTKEGIYAARCPTGHWPLVIGKKKGAVVAAAESGGFSNRGFELVRELEPGEIAVLKNGNLETKKVMECSKKQFCSFIWVYTAFPSDVFQGIPASRARKRLGAALARKDIEKGFIPDVVMPIPDSGRYHAIGYHQEFCRQHKEGKIKKLPEYDEGLIKYPYAGRSFTKDTPEAREEEAGIKILPSGERYDGLVVVVCDDSLVRGVQTRTNLVPKLRYMGIKEIHFRISDPELFSPSPWGKTTKKGEMFVVEFPSKGERLEVLGIESLEFNSIEDLVEAIGLPREDLCVDCNLAAVA